MTSRELARLGRRYMRDLGMPEWNAEFRMCRKLTDDKGNPLDGRSEWHAEERRCWISVCREAQAVEETLMHELLHVLLEGHLTPLKRDKYDPDYELGLNRLAKTLRAKHE